MTVEFDLLMKLFIASILGFIIGLERELKRKPLGLKTCLVICIISCLLTIVSIESAYKFADNPSATMDPLRLAAQIVSGIGFLGAGVILRRSNDSIIGLTTAAMIWGAGGIGIAVGAGFYLYAFIAVGMLIISVELIPFIIRLLGPQKLFEKEIHLRLTILEEENIPSVIEQLNILHLTIQKIHLKDLETGGHLAEMVVLVPESFEATDIYFHVHQLPYISRLEIKMY